MLKYVIPAVALVFVGACGPDDKVDTATESGTPTTDTDTGVYTGPTFLDYIETPSCVGGEIEFYAETRGWTNGENLINIWEQTPGDGWNEEHDLPSVDFGELGWWDALQQLVTPFGGEGSTYERNESSLYSCDGSAVAHSNLYVHRVYDANGNFADCQYIEDDAEGAFDDLLAGTLDQPNDVTNESEINAANCQEWPGNN